MVQYNTNILLQTAEFCCSQIKSEVASWQKLQPQLMMSKIGRGRDHNSDAQRSKKGKILKITDAFYK